MKIKTSPHKPARAPASPSSAPATPTAIQAQGKPRRPPREPKSQDCLDGLRRLRDAAERPEPDESGRWGVVARHPRTLVLHGEEAAALWAELGRLYRAAGEVMPC